MLIQNMNNCHLLSSYYVQNALPELSNFQSNSKEIDRLMEVKKLAQDNIANN